MADTIVIIEGDDYDPCATYILLRKAYLDLLQTGTIKRVRIKNGEDERETEFGVAKVSDLKAAMLDAQRECIEKTTGRPARRAIGIGYRGPLPGRIY